MRPCLRAELNTIVIPLSNVFTRISAAALINFPPPQMRRLFEGGAYSSYYCNCQLESLLHLGQIVITFRTLLHLGQNVITFRPSTNVSYWRRNRHCRWSSELREGLAICRAKVVPSFLSYFKTLSIGPTPGIEPATSCSAVKHSTDWPNPAAVEVVSWQGSPKETRRLMRPGLPSHKEISKMKFAEW